MIAETCYLANVLIDMAGEHRRDPHGDVASLKKTPSGASGWGLLRLVCNFLRKPPAPLVVVDYEASAVWTRT
jgi:hypothetical protein